MTTTIADFEQQIMERGFQEGFQEGFQKSFQEGFQKSFKKSFQKKSREIARLMLGDGEPERKVLRYTGLSTEEIRQIKSEIEKSKC